MEIRLEYFADACLSCLFRGRSLRGKQLYTTITSRGDKRLDCATEYLSWLGAFQDILSEAQQMPSWVHVH